MPPILPILSGDSLVVGHVRVPVKMGYSGNVPRVTGHGVRKKGGCVVNEVGDNHFRKFLQEPDDLGWMWGTQHIRDTFQDRRIVSAPELIRNNSIATVVLARHNR